MLLANGQGRQGRRTTNRGNEACASTEKQKQKQKKKKSTKKSAQEAKAVLWLMDKTNFTQKELTALTKQFSV